MPPNKERRSQRRLALAEKESYLPEDRLAGPRLLPDGYLKTVFDRFLASISLTSSLAVPARFGTLNVVLKYAHHYERDLIVVPA